MALARSTFLNLGKPARPGRFASAPRREAPYRLSPPGLSTGLFPAKQPDPEARHPIGGQRPPLKGGPIHSHVKGISQPAGAKPDTATPRRSGTVQSVAERFRRTVFRRCRWTRYGETRPILQGSWRRRAVPCVRSGLMAAPGCDALAPHSIFWADPPGVPAPGPAARAARGRTVDLRETASAPSLPSCGFGNRRVKPARHAVE